MNKTSSGYCWANPLFKRWTGSQSEKRHAAGSQSKHALIQMEDFSFAMTPFFSTRTGTCALVEKLSKNLFGILGDVEIGLHLILST